MINAGKYNKKIEIYKVINGKDSYGFPVQTKEIIAFPHANVKTTKGYTIIKNNSDFEKALTNFTIRYSKKVENAYYNSDDSNRKLLVDFNNKSYEVQYLKNVDEAGIEIEIQCKEILK